METGKVTTEFNRPGMNPFMEVLSTALSSRREATPLQKLNAYFKQMEKVADAGDIRAWQEKLPQVDALVRAADMDAIRELEVKVQIKKLELTLLLKAGKRALEEAKLTEKKANEAELIEDAVSSQELKQKAHKLERLGSQLHQQLLAKVA